MDDGLRRRQRSQTMTRALGRVAVSRKPFGKPVRPARWSVEEEPLADWVQAIIQGGRARRSRCRAPARLCPLTCSLLAWSPGWNTTRACSTPR
jgi:hypothetical protein